MRTKSGSYRHPVKYWYKPDKEFNAKHLDCQDRVLMVRLCTEEEVQSMIVCPRCEGVRLSRVFAEQYDGD